MRKTALKKILLACIFTAILMSSQAVFADPNLVSCWKFDEGMGTTAYDSADGHDATLVNGPVWTTGRINGALSFDGMDDWVNCGYSFSSVDGSTAKTIVAWVKSDITNYSNSGRVLTLYRAVGSPCFSIIALGNPATWQFEYMVDAVTYSRLNSGTAVAVGQWTHLALVQDGADVTCYVNSVPENNVSNGSAPTLSNPGVANIGCHWNGLINFFEGSIDDVRIYRRVLSSWEIEQLFLYGEIYRSAHPEPADGEVGTDPNVVLSWRPGVEAASHNVYIGTDFNDVNDADVNSTEYKGNFDINRYEPCNIDYGTTYYWRVDEVNEPNLWEGKVWSFKTGRPVIEVSPSQFQFIAPEGGMDPNEQILYISNSGVGSLNWQITYDCNWLEIVPTNGISLGETDEAVISFDISGLPAGRYSCDLTVSDSNAENSPEIVAVNLYITGLASWWKFDETSGTIAYDSAWGNDGDVSGAMWTIGVFDGALDFNGVSDYVDCGDDSSFDSPSYSNALTIIAWIYPCSLSGRQGIVSKWNIAEDAYLLELYDDNVEFRLGYYGGFKSFYASANLQAERWYHIAGVYDGSSMAVYVDGAFVDETAWSTAPSITSARVHIGDLQHTTERRYFDGKIDNVRLYDTALSAGEIEELYWEERGQKAFNPKPFDGRLSVDPNIVLSWVPGKDANSHDVYFGNGYSDVNDANINSPEYRGNFDVNSYDPCGLEEETLYYWRIDEVNDPNLWKGDVWSFDTMMCIVPNVDNMTVAAADAAITAAGLVPGTNTCTTSCTTAYDFNVVSTSPSIGSEVDCGTTVNKVICECYCGQSDYNHWVDRDKPECWCWPRQCLGDADGKPQGKSPNIYWVASNDLTILKTYWQRISPLPHPGWCADFDHRCQGKVPLWYCVASNDLAILKTNWSIPNGPAGTCSPGNRSP